MGGMGRDIVYINSIEAQLSHSSFNHIASKNWLSTSVLPFQSSLNLFSGQGLSLLAPLQSYLFPGTSHLLVPLEKPLRTSHNSSRLQAFVNVISPLPGCFLYGTSYMLSRVGG